MRWPDVLSDKPWELEGELVMRIVPKHKAVLLQNWWYQLHSSKYAEEDPAPAPHLLSLPLESVGWIYSHSG